MNQKGIGKNRDNEKGAALVMVLLVTSLLLVAVIGILLEVTVNTANVTDAAAEQQAYNAAESGIQSAINVLRANTSPNPLLDPAKPATHQNNRMDFAKAVKLNTSNVTGDASTNARLSRWMPYSTTNPDRITLGNPTDGVAYSVTVRDPDNPLQIIELTTTGKIDDDNALTTDTNTRTYGTKTVNDVTISYNAATSGTVNVSTSAATIGLGSFTITRGGTTPLWVTIPDTRFEIKVEMTAPLTAVVILRGTIKGGTISDNSVGNVKIVFDSPAFNLLGSVISLPTGTITPSAPNPSSATTDLSVTVTLSQPKRLVIRSVGYGPRGARKELEAVVERDVFDGLIPATITLVGNSVGSVFNSNLVGFFRRVSYSGGDILSPAKVPPIGTTGGSSSGLLTNITNTLFGCQNCTIDGDPADVSEELPEWLKSPVELNARIEEFREIAKSAGRYYTSGQAPSNGYGNSDGTGITFIDGDANLTDTGGGLTVVTGTLTLTNGFDYSGTIIVTGANGVRRIGSGLGQINGNLIVAPYNINNLNVFLPPKYDITGGGLSNIEYKTLGLLFGSNRVNTVAVGVAEK